MCTTCVAQGVTYVGGAVVGLRVLAARTTRRRARGLLPALPVPGEAVPVEQEPERAQA